MDPCRPTAGAFAGVLVTAAALSAHAAGIMSAAYCFAQ